MTPIECLNVARAVVAQQKLGDKTEAELLEISAGIHRLIQSQLVPGTDNIINAIEKELEWRQTKETHRHLSGEATYRALSEAVKRLTEQAPADRDVLIQAHGIFVFEVYFVAPHTFIFRGADGNGHSASVVAHFSQTVAHVIYRPKDEERRDRVITGFSRAPITQ